MNAQVPDRGQLDHLLDRAERHALTPAEAHLLRVAVGQLWESASSAEARVRAVEAERDEAVREAGAASLLVVACPTCKAPARQRCRAVRGVSAPRWPHSARQDAARKALFAAALSGGEQL